MFLRLATPFVLLLLAQPKVEPQPTTEIEIESDDPKPEPKPESKPAPKPEEKPEAKPDDEPEPKPAAKPASKPDAKPEPAPATQAAPKPEPSDFVPSWKLLQAPAPPSNVTRDEDSDIDYSSDDGEMFEGIRGFVGMGFKPGIGVGFDFNANTPASDPEFAFLWALRGGVLFGRTELAIEFAPMTARPFSPISDPSLSLLFTVGGHLPIAGPVSWPLRGGIGLLAINLPRDSFFSGDDPYFQVRLDLIGLSFDLEYVLLDVYLPSVRAASEFERFLFANWYFGADAVYVF